MLSSAALQYVIIYWTDRRQDEEFENYIVSNLSPNETQGHRTVSWVSLSVIEHCVNHRGQTATIACAGNRTLNGKMACPLENNTVNSGKYLPEIKRKALHRSPGDKSAIMIIRTASYRNTNMERAIKTSHSSDYSSAFPNVQMPRTILK